MALALGLEHPSLLLPIWAEPPLNLRALSLPHRLGKPQSRPASCRSRPSARTFHDTVTSTCRSRPQSRPRARALGRSPTRGFPAPASNAAGGVRRFYTADSNQDSTLLEARAVIFPIRNCALKATYYKGGLRMHPGLEAALVIQCRFEQCASFARHPRAKLGRRRHRV